MSGFLVPERRYNMKIDLELVRQTLKDAFGFESFIASFITRIEEDKKLPTAAINAKGIMSYNPEFVEKHATCKEDLFSLVFHELLHPMFCHFIYKTGMLENIAADAIINATISTIYSEHSRSGNLFRKLYSKKGIQGLLRPKSEMLRSRYFKLYNKLYGQARESDPITTGEVIQALKILAQTERLSTILLIGSHRQEASGAESSNTFPKEVLAKIAEDIRKSLKGKGGHYPGFSLNLMELFLEALKTHLSIKKVLLQKFLTKRKLDRFKEYHNVRKTTVSPIPLYPSKRDLVLLASGFYPGYFHNVQQRPKVTTKGLAIYLDVSGSVNSYLPKIVGVLSKLRKDITSIFLFSNMVVETKFEDLVKGHVRTTYGTDFNCVAKSIIEKGFDKAVIITDGYASMSEELAKELKRIRLATLTILFGEATDCEEFARFGDVVFLDDVCQ